MKRICVLVLCGGSSNERDVSLKTGAQIAKALPKKKYNVRILEIPKNGKIPENNFSRFDVAFIGMHGRWGEDGKIQAFLELMGIPYTGSGVLASALGMNKVKTLELIRVWGIRTPDFLFISQMPQKALDKKKLIRNIIKEIGFPCVVKPNESGSSIGISIVRKKEGLFPALAKAFQEGNAILVEKYIRGRELTCAVMGNTGKTSITILPPVEIRPEGEFFDYHAKYFSKITKEICPAPITAAQTNTIGKLAKKVHETLGCDGLTRSDFILTPRNQFYFLEINTIPGLTEASLSPKEARAHGMTFSEFLEKQIELALAKKK